MRLLIVGAGGHAKVIIDAARASGTEIAGVVGESHGRADLLGVPISETPTGIIADAFIIAIGDNRRREAVFTEYLGMGMRPASVVHPSAIIASDVEVGEGTIVSAGVVVNTGARVGADVILNTGCVIEHDCEVGSHVHIGPLSGLCGGVSVGVGTLVGAGCTIVPMRRIGDWAIVGAGSTVVKDIPSGETHVGVPAHAIGASGSPS